MQKIDADRLISFVGYGPERGAEIVFLGLQEAGGGIANLAARSRFKEVEDLFTSHQEILKPAGVKSPFDNPGNPVRQWNYAARFALALARNPNWNNASTWGEYWRKRLGRHDGTTLLIEVFPFPAPALQAAIPGLPFMSDEELWDQRKLILARYITQNPPTYLIAYGVETKSKVEQLIPNGRDKFPWQLVRGESKMPASVAQCGNTRIAHVGFFGQGCFKSTDIPRVVAALDALGDCH